MLALWTTASGFQGAVNVLEKNTGRYMNSSFYIWELGFVQKKTGLQMAQESLFSVFTSDIYFFILQNLIILA